MQKINFSLTITLCMTIVSMIDCITALSYSDPKKNYPRFHENQMPRKFYIQANIGYSKSFDKIIPEIHEKQSSKASLINIGYGCKINARFSTDVTLSYRRHYKYNAFNDDMFNEKQKIYNLAFMVNGYLTPKTFGNLTPYLMGGVGIAINKTSDIYADKNGSKLLGNQTKNLAWQIGIGTLYQITNNIDLNIAYKYVNLGQVTTKSIAYNGIIFIATPPSKGKLKVHEILAGFSFNL